MDPMLLLGLHGQQAYIKYTYRHTVKNLYTWNQQNCKKLKTKKPCESSKFTFWMCINYRLIFRVDLGLSKASIFRVDLGLSKASIFRVDFGLSKASFFAHVSLDSFFKHFPIELIYLIWTIKFFKFCWFFLQESMLVIFSISFSSKFHWFHLSCPLFQLFIWNFICCSFLVKVGETITDLTLTFFPNI